MISRGALSHGVERVRVLSRGLSVSTSVERPPPWRQKTPGPQGLSSGGDSSATRSAAPHTTHTPTRCPAGPRTALLVQGRRLRPTEEPAAMREPSLMGQVPSSRHDLAGATHGRHTRRRGGHGQGRILAGFPRPYGRLHQPALGPGRPRRRGLHRSPPQSRSPSRAARCDAHPPRRDPGLADLAARASTPKTRIPDALHELEADGYLARLTHIAPHLAAALPIPAHPTPPTSPGGSCNQGDS